MSTWNGESRVQVAHTWSAPVATESTRESGDPLGLRVWASHIANGLAPGLTNANVNLRAYGLLCAGVEAAGQNHVALLGADEAWLRFERLWVIAQTAHAQQTPDGSVAVWAGRNEASRLLDVDGDEYVRLDIPLLGHQLSTGAWGAYRRSATILGFLQAAPLTRGTSPRATARTNAYGIPLSTRWRDENQPLATSIDVAKILAAGTTTRQEATWAFAADRAPTGVRASAYKSMTQVFHQALSTGTRTHTGQCLRGLRRVWNSAGALSPTHLRHHRALLDPSQVDFVPQAAALLWLFHNIEKPYRTYLRTGTGHPEPGAWDSKAWRIAEAYSPEAMALRAHGSRTGSKSWGGTTVWADELASRRGTTATEPGYAPANYDTARPPAMALHAAEALFAQGLLGARMKDVDQVGGVRRRAARSASE